MKFGKLTAKFEVLTVDQLKQVIGGDGSTTAGDGTALPVGTDTSGDYRPGKKVGMFKLGAETTK